MNSDNVLLFCFFSKNILLIDATWCLYVSASYAIIGSDNGLPPNRPQAITWTNAGLLLIGPRGTNFSEIWIEIPMFSFK